MELSNKFLSPTCAPAHGDIATYFLFEKIFRSDGGICVSGAPLVKRLSPSFHCPWLSVVAVWWSLVRFRRAIFFCFCKIAVLGYTAPCGSGFWWRRKSDRGGPTRRSRLGPPTPKAALLARETARFVCAVWALGGAFLGVRADSSRRT